MIKTLDGQQPPRRPGSRREEAAEGGSEASIRAMTGVPPAVDVIDERPQVRAPFLLSVLPKRCLRVTHNSDRAHQSL
jgi:hypothetical protein